jgi:transcriptional regulator of acetoin/glycerol metabolism
VGPSGATPGQGARDESGASAAEPILPLREQERPAIERALAFTEGNVRESARLLGISRATLYRKLAAREETD